MFFLKITTKKANVYFEGHFENADDAYQAALSVAELENVVIVQVIEAGELKERFTVAK